MTSWLENQKCILMKENTRRRRFRLRKNNEADILTQSNPWMNPIHVPLLRLTDDDALLIYDCCSRKSCSGPGTFRQCI